MARRFRSFQTSDALGRLNAKTITVGTSNKMFFAMKVARMETTNSQRRKRLTSLSNWVNCYAVFALKDPIALQLARPKCSTCTLQKTSTTRYMGNTCLGLLSIWGFMVILLAGFSCKGLCWKPKKFFGGIIVQIRLHFHLC